MISSTDIDIDIVRRDTVIVDLPCVRAIEEKDGDRKLHASGVYFQDIPADANGNCVFDYRTAKEIGYFKVDLLSSVDVYAGVKSEAHIDALLQREVDWSLFEHRELVEGLFHIGNHFGVIQSIKPRSIEDIAVILALIRNGKRHLVGRPRPEIDRDIWTPSADGYWFKRAHALAYAHTIIVQANLMYEKMEDSLQDQIDADTSSLLS